MFGFRKKKRSAPTDPVVRLLREAIAAMVLLAVAIPMLMIAHELRDKHSEPSDAPLYMRPPEARKTVDQAMPTAVKWKHRVVHELQLQMPLGDMAFIPAESADELPSLALLWSIGMRRVFHDGTFEEFTFPAPITWAETPMLQSFRVGKERRYVSITADNHVVCFNWTGETLWRTAINPESVVPANLTVSEAPDGSARIFVKNSTMGLSCLDGDGNEQVIFDSPRVPEVEGEPTTFELVWYPVPSAKGGDILLLGVSRAGQFDPGFSGELEGQLIDSRTGKVVQRIIVPYEFWKSPIADVFELLEMKQQYEWAPDPTKAQITIVYEILRGYVPPRTLSENTNRAVEVFDSTGRHVAEIETSTRHMSWLDPRKVTGRRNVMQIDQMSSVLTYRNSPVYLQYMDFPRDIRRLLKPNEMVGQYVTFFLEDQLFFAFKTSDSRVMFYIIEEEIEP